jgi:uncharacterized membrane protein
MTTVIESVEVAVPMRTAYNQWTQSEEFPSFMEGVDEVRQLTDTRTRWVTSFGGATREFDAEIGVETGGWRGHIPPSATSDHSIQTI